VTNWTVHQIASNARLKSKPALFVVLVLLGAVPAWLIREGILIPNQPPRSRYPLRGVDVSHHNGTIDWRAVAADGYEFAYIKATEGATFRDPRFSTNWKAAGQAGIIRGAYHFFSPHSSGNRQAEHYIRTVPREGGCLPPVIDAEFDADRTRLTLDQFLAELRVLSGRLEQYYGSAPILYTTPQFHTGFLKGRPVARLWARAVITWPSEEAQGWLFWQYSSCGRVQGIAGRTDLNVFHAGRSELAALLTPHSR
jgi:lysozyme